MKNIRSLVLGLVLVSLAGCATTPVKKNPSINRFVQGGGLDTSVIHIVADCTIPTYFDSEGTSGLDVSLNNAICEAIAKKAGSAAKRLGLNQDPTVKHQTVSVGARAGRNYRYKNAAAIQSQESGGKWVETPIVDGARVDARTLQLRSLTSQIDAKFQRWAKFLTNLGYKQGSWGQTRHAYREEISQLKLREGIVPAHKQTLLVLVGGQHIARPFDRKTDAVAAAQKITTGLATLALTQGRAIAWGSKNTNSLLYAQFIILNESGDLVYTKVCGTSSNKKFDTFAKNLVDCGFIGGLGR